MIRGRWVLLVLVLAGAGLLSCGESTGPDPNAVARVVISPDGGSLDTGDSLQFTAVARNAAGDELSGKSFAWSTLDTALVTVTSGGRVRARWPGVARLVATSGERSDTARIAIQGKITSLTVTPALDTLTALGATVVVTVHASIGTRGYAGGSYTWELTDTTVAKLLPFGASDSSRTLQAYKNGTTILRIREARQAVDSARIVVQQRVASILAPQSTGAFRGCSRRIFAVAVDALNNPVQGAVLAWASTDTTLARVDASGLVTPLGVGVDTIVISSEGVTRRVALVIDAAATPVLQTSGAFAPVTTVGVGQYALAFGNVGNFPYYNAPARFRVVSSDTAILKSVPADTEAYLVSTTVLAGPVRLVGRAVGDVMLTPYLCDTEGASAPFRVTRAKLGLFDSPPSTARTDDPPVNLTIRTQDSTGDWLFPAEPLTVRISATDTNVIRPDSAYRHLAIGVNQFYVNFTFPDTGTARIVLSDSAGAYIPDTSSAVRVVYPPLYLFSNGGAGQPDTLHVGLRQKPFYDVYQAQVGLDRFVVGAPLRIYVSSSDSVIARVAPDSLDIPVGQSASGGFDIAARDTRGTAIITARAHRHVDDRIVMVVGRPAVQVSAPAGYLLYPGGPFPAVQVFAVDSTTGAAGFPTENVTFSLTVSDTAVVSLDSTTLTVPAGDHASGLAGITFKKPGTATITATDPRVAPYSYGSATSAPIVISEPYLSADSVVSLGIGQNWSFNVLINGNMSPGEVVHLAHTNPTVASLADSVGHVIVPGYVGVLATGVSAGVDTVIATAPGFRPDTGVIIVGAGTIHLQYWPSTLAVGDTWPLSINLLAPSGEGRITADAVVFTLSPDANVEFHQDGAVTSTVTILAGQQSSYPNFYVKAKAAGTGSATITAPNYVPLTKTVPISP